MLLPEYTLAPPNAHFTYVTRYEKTDQIYKFQGFDTMILLIYTSSKETYKDDFFLRDIKAWDQQCSIRIRIIRTLGHAHRTLL